MWPDLLDQVPRVLISSEHVAIGAAAAARSAAAATKPEPAREKRREALALTRIEHAVHLSEGFRQGLFDSQCGCVGSSARFSDRGVVERFAADRLRDVLTRAAETAP